MKRVLFAVLDWGLGHATRSIPIINELIETNFEVIIAGSGASLKLLRNEYPTLRSYDLPGYDPIYPRDGSMVIAMVAQLPKFVQAIRREHQTLKRIIANENIDAVISDNRYGCWSSEKYSVIITHQSNIQMPKRFGWLAPFIRKITLRMLKNFSECWVPDTNGGFLSGALSDFSHRPDLAVTFIGPLSRLKVLAHPTIKYDILAVFSGPEPQRSIFEKTVEDQLNKSGKSFFVVRGLPFNNENDKDNNALNFAGIEKLSELMASSDVIIARSGYSTVMDLLALKKKAILVPTPGQTEQEYLAKCLGEKAWFYCVNQSEFNLPSALASVHDCKVPSDIDFSDHKMLRDAICKLNARLLN